MKISKWIDQFLIYEQDKFYRRVVTLSFFTGPVLNAYLFYDREFEVATKLNLSVLIYVSYVFLIYGCIREILRKVGVEDIITSWRGRFFLTFFVCLTTLLLTGHFIYEYVYEPILHYSHPKNYDVILTTTTMWSLVATGVIESLKNDIDSVFD